MNQQNPILVEPTATLEAEFIEMAQDFLAADDLRYKSAIENFKLYLQRLSHSALGINLPSNRVPQTTFWLFYNRKILGTSNLRHLLTPELEHHGGHIGYDIRPSERCKGYGTTILTLTLEKAKILGLSKTLLTCDTDNTASAKIIEKNSGKLVGQTISNKSGEQISQYWIEL